jgi:hypothetical protein
MVSCLPAFHRQQSTGGHQRISACMSSSTCTTLQLKAYKGCSAAAFLAEPRLCRPPGAA